MTPPAEGERARAIVKILRRYLGGGAGDFEDAADAVLASLRAPQPSGLTGDAIREACAKVCDDLRYKGETPVVTIKAGNQALRDAAERIRALNLSAVEGAPAAGEREVVDSACDNLPAARLGEIALRAGGSRTDVGDAIDRGLILLRLLRAGGFEVAPASPRSAAPEDK